MSEGAALAKLAQFEFPEVTFLTVSVTCNELDKFWLMQVLPEQIWLEAQFIDNSCLTPQESNQNTPLLKHCWYARGVQVFWLMHWLPEQVWLPVQACEIPWLFPQESNQ